MIQVPMSPSEFAAIKSQLSRIDPDKIKLSPISDNHGSMTGKKGIFRWTAEYSYVNGELTVIGHSFADRAEKGIMDELMPALDAMRTSQPIISVTN